VRAGIWSVVALATLPASAIARAVRPRADLTVSSGSVRAAGGKLSGSFVVRDGGAAVGASTATLSIRVAKKPRLVKRFTVPALRAGASAKVVVAGVSLPAGLAVGSYAIDVCVDGRAQIRERSETNNCRSVGKLSIRSPDTVTPVRPATPTPTPPVVDEPPAPDPAPPAPPSSFPTDPLPPGSYTENANGFFALPGTPTPYSVYLPRSYDASHQTPTSLLVWMHGCGDTASNALNVVASFASRPTQRWITVTVGGRDSACWNVNSDSSLVLSVIADVKSHFNVNPRSVVLGGTLDGGSLAYRTAFYNANLFAGLLLAGSSPFYLTGSTQSASVAAAAWKFNVVHVIHTADTVFPPETVRAETQALADAGFPVTPLERPYDSSYTGDELVNDLLPHMSDGWLSPAP
jgi:predicted esterase